MNRADVGDVKRALAQLSASERGQVLMDALGPVWGECPDARNLTDAMRATLPRFGDVAAAELLFCLACWLEERDAWPVLL